MTIQGSSDQEISKLIEKDLTESFNASVKKWSDKNALHGNGEENKTPLIREFWINKKTNEFIYILISDNITVSFSDSFNIYDMSIDLFRKTYKYISGVECEKDLQIYRLNQENRKYKKALEFYASFENYIGQDSFSASIDVDCGEIAREALK
jgi:hypothetical protein